MWQEEGTSLLQGASVKVAAVGGNAPVQGASLPPGGLSAEANQEERPSARSHVCTPL